MLDGKGIRGVDRGGKLYRFNFLGYGADASQGKSDPFAVFTLNEQKVFKSHTKKKTLTPEWNEQFAVQVVSLFG